MKICPRCGSKNVDWIIPQNWSVWECKDCDYTGPIIEGNERIAKEIKEDYEILLKKEKARIKKYSKNKDNFEEEDSEKEEKEYKEEEIEDDLSDEEIDRKLDNLDI